MNATFAATLDELCQAAAHRHGEVGEVVDELVGIHAPLASSGERARLRAAAIARLAGLDVIDGLLADEGVDEVMVVAGREVWVERNGTIARAAHLEPGVADAILERALAPLGRRVDRTSPIVDARLPGGHRLCAVVPPVALDGIAVAVRRHRSRFVPLVRFASTEVCALLAELVHRRCNILITGATSSGKTTLLGALLGEVGDEERIVLIEDTSELQIDHPHVVRLEARPPSSEGLAEIDSAALVKTALRLRPDRLIVGEFRGGEVLAVLQSLHTGHDGSLSTCHANDAADALRRVETLALQAAPNWPLAAIRRTIASSLDVIVHVGRARAGARTVHEVAEVIDADGDQPLGVRTLVRDHTVVARLERGRR